MQVKFLVRKVHKWLALVVGIQALIWFVSGVFMTAISIDLIHGDHLVKVIEPTSLTDKVVGPLPQKAFQRYGDLSAITLTQRMGKAVYLLKTKEGDIVLDAVDGSIIGELTHEEVEVLADQYYAGKGHRVQVRRLEQYPREIGGRDLPVWQVKYDDWLNSTLYFDVNNANLIRKRSDLWRWFDFMWMLHIMDYDTRDDINTNLLRLAAALGLLMSFTGLCLVWYRLWPGRVK